MTLRPFLSHTRAIVAYNYRDELNYNDETIIEITQLIIYAFTISDFQFKPPIYAFSAASPHYRHYYRLLVSSKCAQHKKKIKSLKV